MRLAGARLACDDTACGCVWCAHVVTALLACVTRRYTLYHGVSTDGGDNCGYLVFDMRADCLLLHLGHAYAAGSVGRLRLPAGFIAAVHDVTDAGGVSAPGWAGELLASSITPDASPQEAVCGGDTEWSGEVDVGGRTWRVTACESQAAFGDSVDDTATIVIILCVVHQSVAWAPALRSAQLTDASAHLCCARVPTQCRCRAHCCGGRRRVWSLQPRGHVRNDSHDAATDGGIGDHARPDHDVRTEA